MPWSAIKILFGLMTVLLSLFLLATFSLKNEIAVDNRSLTAHLSVLSDPPAAAGGEVTKRNPVRIHSSQADVRPETTLQKSSALVSDTQESSESRTNILVLGMSGPGYEAPYLTDTILLLSIDSASGNVTMISLPRDLYVEIPFVENAPPFFAGYYTKINALYQLGKNSSSEKLGAEMMKEKARDITGLAIDYYALMDLEGLKEIIDQIGGLNVFVEKDVFDPRFPTKNFGTEIFELKNGWRWLDGETALRYVRTRHDLEGDFGRVKRQQAVVEALRKKIVGMNPLWDLPKIIEIVQTLRRELKTDVGVLDIKRLWDLSRNIDSSKITHIVISAKGGDANLENGLLQESTTIMGGKTGFILVPKAGIENYEEIQEYIRTKISND